MRSREPLEPTKMAFSIGNLSLLDHWLRLKCTNLAIYFVSTLEWKNTCKMQFFQTSLDPGGPNLNFRISFFTGQNGGNKLKLVDDVTTKKFEMVDYDLTKFKMADDDVTA